MKLEAMFQDVPVLEWQGLREGEVTGVAYHSHAVNRGTLFCTWQGQKSDGHIYLQDAVARGASAVVVEKQVGDLPCPRIIVRSGRLALSRIAANFYARPAHQLKMVGITGTNGKTSTAFLLHHLLKGQGIKAGLLGTVIYDLGDGVISAERTTPEGLDIQRYLRRMADCGCTAAVMETSSHALEQGRIDGVPFSAAVFTHLSHDHLDYHGTMENYFSAKLRLFLSLKEGSTAVVNQDDSYGRRILETLPPGVRGVTYGMEPGADFEATGATYSSTGTRFRLSYQGSTREVVSRWIGPFNVANALAALSTGFALGLDLDQVIENLATAPSVPGRMELLPHEGNFAVVVDYAHTDDAVSKVADALRPLTKNRLRVLVGCGGNRDKTKRPLMARAACEKADDVILTSDNPRNEKPGEILDQMVEGVKNFSNYRVIVDRAEAIREIIHSAQAGDVILLAGKGHETYQEVAGVKHPFSDREQALLALKEVAV